MPAFRFWRKARSLFSLLTARYDSLWCCRYNNQASAAETQPAITAEMSRVKILSWEENQPDRRAQNWHPPRLDVMKQMMVIRLQKFSFRVENSFADGYTKVVDWCR